MVEEALESQDNLDLSYSLVGVVVVGSVTSKNLGIKIKEAKGVCVKIKQTAGI